MLTNYPKISIVTPNYNGAKYLESTILSVINQQYPNLEYIIVDGASTDQSLDIIKKYEKNIYNWTSEPDNGMYDALNKGFQKSTGEIMGWINSDDILQYKSLWNIASIFTHNPQVEWVEGINSLFNDEEMNIKIHVPPSRHYYMYLDKSLQNTDFYFIQQESTYWRRSLFQKAGHHIDTTLQYAGDFELWMRFFKYAPLYHIDSLLGGFRYIGATQKSVGNADKYRQECNAVIDYHISKMDKKQIADFNKFVFMKNLMYSIPKFGRFFGNRYLRKYFNNKLITYHPGLKIFKIN
ncbi:MAG: glycosyltransferase family 2 protein [Cytophagales bacterium]|nr:glycosyltransferase family 2 protein [Cytophagales bacterium]